MNLLLLFCFSLVLSLTSKENSILIKKSFCPNSRILPLFLSLNYWEVEVKKKLVAKGENPQCIHYFCGKPGCMIAYSLTWIKTSVEISLLRCDAMTLRNEFTFEKTRPSVMVTVYFWHINSKFLECQNVL